MCALLGVSRSGYYAYLKREPSARARANAALTVHIETIFAASGGTYGSPRVTAELRAHGQRVGRNRVARLMRAAGLVAHRARRYRQRQAHTNPDRAAPNRLRDGFEAAAPNQIWLADLTQIRTAEGWLYLATELDLFSRRVVGWAMAASRSSDLVERALEMAFRQRRPAAGLVHHSDRGGEYMADSFQRLLGRWDAQPSMSRAGHCEDNAPMEAFIATLKGEVIYRQTWDSRAAVRRALFPYIEGFYNRTRRHSALGYLSPDDFERRFGDEPP